MKQIRDNWATSEDPVSMLRYAGTLVVPRQLVLAACAVARLALVYVRAGELRPLRAIETAEAWARGEVALSEVVARRTEAWAARQAEWPIRPAAAHAAYAAYIATYTTTTNTTIAVYAAIYAVDAAAYAAAYAADAADRRRMQLASCAAIRGVVPCPYHEDCHEHPDLGAACAASRLQEAS